MSVLMFAARSRGQQFTAVQGSIYGSVLDDASQPAAGVNMPYRWAVAVAGVNSFWSNNIYSVSPVRWTKDGTRPQGYFIRGSGKRWAVVNSDIHLLNFLVRLPIQRAVVVGAGLNLHSRTRGDRMNYQLGDSVETMGDFLEANVFNRTGDARAVDQQWLEVYLTASTVLRDDATERLTVGGTLRISKGITAAVVDLQDVSVGPDKSDPRRLVFRSSGGRYGYSKNLEELNGDNGNDFKGALHTLMGSSGFSPGLDIGFTYLRKKQDDIAGFTNDDPADYRWKLEVALTGLGSIKYDLGTQSMTLQGLQGQPSVDRFAQMTSSFSSLEDFNDSLARLITIKPWTGKVAVSLPTTLRVNYDRNLGRRFYLNAGAALNVSFLDFGADYRIGGPAWLQLTPRWEITRVGVYAPLYIDTHGTVMAGAAVRLGPLVVGVHDFGWLFHPREKGGAYAALVIKGLFGKKSECPSL
jgi:hypothetical protein